MKCLFVADFNATCIDLHISDNCMLLTGYMALYKVFTKRILSLKLLSSIYLWFVTPRQGIKLLNIGNFRFPLAFPCSS